MHDEQSLTGFLFGSQSFTTNILSSRFKKALNAYVKTPDLIPQYTAEDILRETRALENVSTINPKDQKQFDSWILFYATVRLLNADNPRKDIYSTLANNKEFMRTLETGRDFFAELAIQYPRDQNVHEILKTFEGVRYKLLENANYRDVFDVVKGWHTKKEADQQKADRVAFVCAKNKPPIQVFSQLRQDINRESPLIGNTQFSPVKANATNEERQTRITAIFGAVRTMFKNDPRLTDERIGEIACALCAQSPIGVIMANNQEKYCTDANGEVTKFCREDKTTPRQRAVHVDPHTQEVVFFTKASYDMLSADDMEGQPVGKLQVSFQIRIPKETLLTVRSMEALKPQDIFIHHHTDVSKPK